MDYIIQWPAAPSTTLWLAAAGALLVLLLAVVSEMLRQRGLRKRRLEAAWRTVRKIAQDKELTDDELQLLHSMVSRWMPDDPLHAATVRQQFDHCVAAEMDALLAKGDEEAYAKRGLVLRDIRAKLGLDYVPIGQRIYSTRELYTDMTLFVAKEGESPPQWHRVRVMEIDEAYFYTALQELKEDSKPFFKRGEKVRCRMWREDDARYAFTVVYDHFEESPPLMVFRHSDALKRVQARAHFRVRVDFPVTVGILNAPVGGSAPVGEANLSKRPVVTRVRGQLTSLSAGGFAMNAQQPVSPHVLLRIPLELDASGPIQVEARVVSSTPLFGGRYLVRGSFVGISDEKRDKIARYVLYRQKNLLPGAKKAK